MPEAQHETRMEFTSTPELLPGSFANVRSSRMFNFLIRIGGCLGSPAKSVMNHGHPQLVPPITISNGSRSMMESVLEDDTRSSFVFCNIELPYSFSLHQQNPKMLWRPREDCEDWEFLEEIGPSGNSLELLELQMSPGAHCFSKVLQRAPESSGACIASKKKEFSEFLFYFTSFLFYYLLSNRGTRFDETCVLKQITCNLMAS